MRHRLIPLLLLLAACGGSSNDDEQKKTGKPPAKPPVRPAAGNALVNVDNGSLEHWELSVDGKPRCKLPPHTIVGFQLEAGRHEFVVSGRDGEVERLEATLEPGKLAVLNPRALGSYELFTVTYVSGPARWSFGGAGPRTKKLGNPKLLQVRSYYDLLHDLPSTIRMRVRLGQMNASETRSKLYRAAASSPTPAEVAAMVAGNPEAYSASARKQAVKQLAAMPPDPAVLALLVSCVDRGRQSDAALKVLAARYADQLAPAKLGAWLAGPAAGGAARLLVARKEGDRVIEAFARVPDKQKAAVLQAMQQAPEAQRKRLALAVLPLPWQGQRSALHGLIHGRGLVLDPAFAERIESHIAGLPARERRSWEPSWHGKLCADADKLPKEWIVPRLVKLLADKTMASRAIEALVRAGAADKLAAAQLEPAQRWALYRQICTKLLRGTPPAPAEKALLDAGLGDADTKLRSYLFSTMCFKLFDDSAVRSRLTAVLQAERDERTRAEMDRAYTRALQANLRNATPETWRKLALGGASQGAVAHAIEQLYRDYRQREQHLAALAAGYDAASPANRAWLLAGLRRFGSLAGAAALFRRGLADPDGTVRAAAISGWLAVLYKIGPEATELRAAIDKEPDTARRATMLRSYNLWLVARLDRERRRATTRDQAQQKLLALAADPDPEVSYAALGKLSFLRQADLPLLPALTRLFERAPERRHKERILQNVQFIGDDAILPLFEKALADPDARLRESAFSLLWYAVRNRKMQDAAVRPLLERAAETEADAKAKSRMMRLLQRKR